MKSQTVMFTSGEDLPLFSGTPQRAVVEVFQPQEVHAQLGFFSCPICRDTGIVELTNAHTVKCFCVDRAEHVDDPDGPAYFEVKEAGFGYDD